MDNLLLIAIALIAMAVLANLAQAFGVDSREDFGAMAPGLS